jgi:hypothetical protein
MDEATRRLAQCARQILDLQLFADPDPDFGDPPQTDLDALGDDPVKLKAALVKQLAFGKKVVNEAAKRRIAMSEDHQKVLKTIQNVERERDITERERDELKAKLETAEADLTKTKADLETANRSNGQHLANFKSARIDEALTSALKEAGMSDDVLLLALPAIKRDGITCDENNKFAIAGVKEVVDAYKVEKPTLFKGAPTTGPRGTSAGTGPTGGSVTGGGKTKIDYRDKSKSFEELQRESDIEKYGRPLGTSF